DGDGEVDEVIGRRRVEPRVQGVAPHRVGGRQDAARRVEAPQGPHPGAAARGAVQVAGLLEMVEGGDHRAAGHGERRAQRTLRRQAGPRPEVADVDQFADGVGQLLVERTRTGRPVPEQLQQLDLADPPMGHRLLRAPVYGPWSDNARSNSADVDRTAGRWWVSSAAWTTT